MTSNSVAEVSQLRRRIDPVGEDGGGACYVDFDKQEPYVVGDEVEICVQEERAVLAEVFVFAVIAPPADRYEVQREDCELRKLLLRQIVVKRSCGDLAEGAPTAGVVLI